MAEVKEDQVERFSFVWGFKKGTPIREMFQKKKYKEKMRSPVFKEKYGTEWELQSYPRGSKT